MKIIYSHYFMKQRKNPVNITQFVKVRLSFSFYFPFSLFVTSICWKSWIWVQEVTPSLFLKAEWFKRLLPQFRRWPEKVTGRQLWMKKHWSILVHSLEEVVRCCLSTHSLFKSTEYYKTITYQLIFISYSILLFCDSFKTLKYLWCLLFQFSHRTITKKMPYRIFNNR